MKISERVSKLLRSNYEASLKQGIRASLEHVVESQDRNDNISSEVDEFLSSAKEVTAQLVREGSREIAVASLSLSLGVGLAGCSAPIGHVPMIIFGTMLGGVLADLLSRKVLSEKRARKVGRVVNKLSELYTKIMKSMPRFIYPSVHKASDAERELVYKTLDKLPMSYITASHTITFSDKLAKEVNAAGLFQDFGYDGIITLDRSQMALSDEWAQYVITHELGHANDFMWAHQLNGLISSKPPFGKPPYITDYASTKPLEDVAESYAYYHLAPESLKSVAPEKYCALEKIETVKSLDPLNIVAGQQQVRSLGRTIGEFLSKIPYPVRTFMVGLGTALPLLSLRSGAEKYLDSINKRDPKKGLTAKLTMTTALASLLSTPTVSLSTVVMAYTLTKAVEKGKISMDTASKIVEASMALILGPIGCAIAGIYHGLNSVSRHREVSEDMAVQDKLSGKQVSRSGSERRSESKGEKANGILSILKKYRHVIAMIGSGIAGAVIALALSNPIGPILGTAVANSFGFSAGAVTEIVGGRLITSALTYLGARLGVNLGSKVISLRRERDNE